MAYRPIDAETRIEIVKQYWAGHKISELENEFRVNRDSIHIWINKAEDAIQEALSSKKPGPKKDQVMELIHRNNELEKINEQIQKEINRLSQNSQVVASVSRGQFDLRPSVCPSCGCNVIWKNGTYKCKDGQVQRFRCSACKTKIFLEVKKTP